MSFIETRGNENSRPSEVEFSDAMLNPSASYGGLYVPKEIPSLDLSEIDSWKDLSYIDLAKNVIKKLKLDISDEILDEALERYNHFDDKNDPVPVKKIDENLYCSELWHGPTRAFKDMALQPFGVILSRIAQARKENYIILAATSGDTGPAALSTFEGKDNVKVVCLYPDGGTSDVQRLQMTTMPKSNLKVLGIKGSFDDAQNALKSLLKDDEFKSFLSNHDTKLSAANSVNFGRIAFQIVYHFHSYLKLLKEGAIKSGEKIDLVVPSGNFGNALGAYYAKKMGVPIDCIGIASNDNNILTDLINDGVYDLNSKTLVPTISPAMDILKSSNVERVLFDKFGPQRTKELMEDLENTNKYQLTADELKSLREDFDATFSTEDEVRSAIQDFGKKDYVLEPHTATCIKSVKDNGKKTVIYSTAEWTKFSVSVINALDGTNKEMKDLEALQLINKEHGLSLPELVVEIFEKPENHLDIIEKTAIKEGIEKFIS
ncbi:MAG: threonine synthase [Campylobacterales bacterium]|nr:threonine synthase [Campylobacterales bacterium]